MRFLGLRSQHGLGNRSSKLAETRRKSATAVSTKAAGATGRALIPGEAWKPQDDQAAELAASGVDESPRRSKLVADDR
jgi:hypothetical protein